MESKLRNSLGELVTQEEKCRILEFLEEWKNDYEAQEVNNGTK